VLKPAEFFGLLLVILVSLAVNAISAPSFKDEAVAEYEKIGDITVYCCYPPGTVAGVSATHLASRVGYLLSSDFDLGFGRLSATRNS
jgi:hypothetical protein